MSVQRRAGRLKVAVILTVMTVLAGCSSGGGPDDDADTASPSDAASSVAETEDDAAAAEPAALNADGVLAGTATGLTFDAGEPGEVSTVATGVYDPDSGTFPFVFRNNTSEAVSHVDASATARDSSGTLVGTGSSQGTTPAQIPPGGLGLAYIYFDDPEKKVTGDATLEFTFETSPADTSSYNTADVQVTEAQATGSTIIGTGVNQNDATLTGPYGVSVFCFDAGTLLGHSGTYTNEDADLEPDDTVSYTVDLFDDPCPTFVVGISGYFA